MVVSDTDRSISAQVKKSRSSLPTVGIYRPPAARKSSDSLSKAPTPPSSGPAIVDAPKNAVTSASGRTRVRRPDQQVYVPRAKRAFQDPEKYEDPTAISLETRSTSQLTNTPISNSHLGETFKSGSSLIIDDQKSSKPRSSSPTGTPASLPPRASQLVETKKKLCQSSSSDLDCIGSRISSESERLSSTMNTTQSVIPPRVEVLVEKKKKLCQTRSLTLEEFRWKAKDNDEVNEEGNLQILPASDADSGQLSAISRSKVKNSTVVSESASVIDSKVTITSPVSDMPGDCDIVKVGSCSQLEELLDSVKNRRASRDAESSQVVATNKEGLRPPKQFIQGTESSDDDFQDARNDEKTTALTNISDRSSGGSSESLSSSDSLNPHVSPVQLMKPVKSEPKKKSSTEKTARVFNPDECDWDALLDEDGDVLDPFLMKELTSAVGEVQISQPKSDYRNYRSQVPADHPKTRRSTSDDDFNHVVEIFSFPPEFKTSDLVAVLSPFKNTAGGFEIKWVDDTHALGVFASALIAEQVLAYQHPMVRTRPLCDATLESRLKAKRLAESIQSFRPRPETCAALARRLVTGALGVKLPTARQEREEEKRVLREAREKRRLAVQQQDDVWNG